MSNSTSQFMAELKTKKTDSSVESYISSIQNAETQTDCRRLLALMQAVCKSEARMWGSSIVGVGDFRYKNSSGKWTDWFKIGFSSRKAAISIYIGTGIQASDAELSALGTCSSGVGCLYVKKLSDVRIDLLEGLLLRAEHKLQKLYEESLSTVPEPRKSANSRSSKSRADSEASAEPSSLAKTSTSRSGSKSSKSSKSTTPAKSKRSTKAATSSASISSASVAKKMSQASGSAKPVKAVSRASKKRP